MAKIVETYQVTIALGLKEGYTGKQHTLDNITEFVLRFCTDNKLGVTITPTRFVYVNGWEDGVLIGIINYPRFPKPILEIKQTAISLAMKCMRRFKQHRVSVITPNKTIMLENTKLPDFKP